LERIARKPGSEQADEVTKIKKEREDKEKARKAEKEKSEEQRRKDQEQKEFDALVKAWTKARPSAREKFREHIAN